MCVWTSAESIYYKGSTLQNDRINQKIDFMPFELVVAVAGPLNFTSVPFLSSIILFILEKIERLKDSPPLTKKVRNQFLLLITILFIFDFTYVFRNVFVEELSYSQKWTLAKSLFYFIRVPCFSCFFCSGGAVNFKRLALHNIWTWGKKLSTNEMSPIGVSTPWSLVDK